MRRLLLGALAAGVLATIIVVGRHTLAQSLHVLGSADLGWLALALAVEVVSLTAFGLSRRHLLRANGHHVSFRSVMAVTYASNALSSSVPFAGTELAVVYAYRQFRRHGSDAPTTSWALAVSAIFSTSALSFVLVTGAIAAGEGTAVFGFAGAAVYLVPGAGVLLALRYTRVRNALHRVLAYLAGVSRRLFGKPENGADGLDHFLDEVSSTHLPRRKYAEVFGLAVANWLFDCAALALAIRAMGEPIPWHDLLLVYGAGAAVGSTGITPGGFGVVELTLTAALAAGDMPDPKALAAVLAYRLVNFWLVLACGWVAMGVLARTGRRRKLPTSRCRHPPAPSASRCRTNYREPAISPAHRPALRVATGEQAASQGPSTTRDAPRDRTREHHSRHNTPRGRSHHACRQQSACRRDDLHLLFPAGLAYTAFGG